MPKKEIDQFIQYNNKVRFRDLPGPIVFSKTFLSFSKEIETAKDFLNNTEENNNFYKVLITLTKDDSKDDNINYSLSTHADIEKISFFPREKEVLFFPFSCFAIQNVEKDNSGVYKIGLLYLGKYLKTIESIDISFLKESTEDDKDGTNLGKELSNSGLISNIPLAKRPRAIVQVFKENKIKSVHINNPIYQKNAIYPVSPIPRTRSLTPPPSPNENNVKENYIKENYIKENYIIGYFKVTENDINKNIRIINSFEENKRNNIFEVECEDDDKYKNEKEIKENCVIEINKKIIPFSYFYLFKDIGKHLIKYTFKKNYPK
jgi:hypothetical protein